MMTMTMTKVIQTGFLNFKSQKANAIQTLARTMECVSRKAREDSNVIVPGLTRERDAREVLKFVERVHAGVVNAC